MTVGPITVALSLVSHTNVGKTTLARTLLRFDIALSRIIERKDNVSRGIETRIAETRE